METDPFLTEGRQAGASEPEDETLRRDNSQPELAFAFLDRTEGSLKGHVKNYSRLPELPIRKLTVQVMNALAEERLLEEEWQKKAQQHLDFSDRNLFRLESFRPEDFAWGGLVKNREGKEDVRRPPGGEPVMPVYKLRTLNLDNNELTDEDFEPWTNKVSSKGLSGVVFRNLEVLRMKKNRLTYPMLIMPRLRELHLSYNDIVRIPPLAGLKQLEVLVLSHNKIDAIDDHHLKDTQNLKRLHLNDNKLKLDASSLYGVIDSLSAARELEHLHFQGNPFCTYLNEYQILVVMFLSQLKRLDDIDLSKSKSLRESMLEEARRAGMDRDRDREDLKRELHKLDLQVKHRMKSEFSKTRPQGTGRPVLPKIDSLIEELDEALVDSSNIVTSAALVYELASQLTKDGSGNYNTVCQYLFDVRQKKAGEDPRAVKEGFAATFVQQVTLLAERFPDVRPLLLRTLAKFCPMEPNRFGELCLGALATLAKGGADRQREVLSVVQEMLIPFIAEKNLSNPVGDSSWETVVIGVSKLTCPELGEIMSDSVVPYLGNWYKYVMTASSAHPKLKSALIVLIRCAVQVKEHALKVIDERFLREMCMSLLSLKWWQPDLFSDFLGVSGILEGCIKSCQDKVVPILRSIEFPRKLLKVVRGVMDEHEGKDELSVPVLVLSKKIGASLRLLSHMMQDPALLQEQVGLDKEEKKLMGHTLLIAPSKALPDPVVLASSLECLHLLLKDTSGCRLYLDLVVSQLHLDKSQNKVLPFLSSKRFQDVINGCERHTAIQDDAALSHDGTGPAHQSQLVDFATATDAHAHEVIVSIVHFISVFPAMANEFELCKQVSQTMNEQGRETLLFKLLGTPSNDVRVAVLQFLESATDELDFAEQKQLVDMLTTGHVEQELPLLKSLLETLQRFICKEGEIGDMFRSTYAGTVLLKAFQVMSVNAERPTYGNQIEEEQKLSLSREAMALLAGASQQPLLRMVRHPSDPDEELLRCDEIAFEFCKIIKFEEQLHRHSVSDVPLELIWTGRHVPILLRFLNPTSSEAVNSGKKQGFRIFAQIADVIAGLQRGIDGKPGQPVAAKSLPTSAKDRAEAESEMWNVTTMRLQVNRLDDHAYSDRYHQQDSFVTCHGLEQMLYFLEHGIAQHNSTGQVGGHGGHRHHGHWESLVSAIGNVQVGSASARAAQRPVVRAMERQRQAKDHLAKIVQHVSNRKHEKAQVQREQAQMEDPEVIPLPAVAKTPTLVGEALARKFFIEDAWKHTLQPDAVSLRGNVVPVVPHFLRARHKGPFVDAHGHVGLHYYVAAMLRAIYAIFVAPMDPRFKEAMTRQLQNSMMHSRLMALMEVCGSFVDCNIVAKFMRIMSMVLRWPPHDFRGVDRDIGGLHAEAFFAATLACRCIHMVAPLLESVGREYSLSLEQQTLVQEAIRLLRAVGHFTTSVRFTDVREIQAECMEMAFDVVLPMPAVRGIFMCLLYDVQAGIGMQHGSGISKHFVDSMLGRQEFHELCSEVLSLAVTSSEKTRYEVLELCNRFKVLKRQGLHTSFLKQLIDHTEIHNFTLAMQQALDEQPAVAEEQAMEFFLGEWEAKSHPGGESVGISFLAATDFLITAIGRPIQTAMGPLKVNLWSAASKKVLASVEIGPYSDDDERPGRYTYQALETPVRIECGKEYRLVQENIAGAEASWHEGYINPAEAAALVSNAYASLLGGVSGQLYSYPAHFDGEFRRAGMLNFVIEQKESIRHCLDVEILEYGGGTYGWGFSSASRPHQRMVITNKRLLLMEVPRGGFNTSNLQSLTAGISQQYSLSNLVRITCQTDTQMFILGFMESSRLGSISEHWICVICHKSDVRQRVLETLSELSGPSLQVRIHPTRDVLMHQAITKRTSSQILCMTYAFNGDALRFYVLTNTELCEFELHFESWVPSPKVIPYTGYEDILASKDDAKLVKRMKEEQQRGNLSTSRFVAPFGDHLYRRSAALDATMTHFYRVDHEDFLPGVTAADPEQQRNYELDLKMFREAQQQVLTMVRKPPLSQLREVEFDTGELPALKLTFKRFTTDMDVISMRFMDDVARERWRRCLAMALRGQSDHAEHWDRHWTGGASP